MSEIALTIKQKAFEQIVLGIKNNQINFDAEGGCACGRLEVKLNEQLYMSVHRSCRKSSSTPDNQLWNIDKFEFHTTPYDAYYDEEDSTFEMINMKLNKEQEKELIELLEEVTIDIWGEKYR